jgi:hypothetical protein
MGEEEGRSEVIEKVDKGGGKGKAATKEVKEGEVGCWV